jgi:hypothetical protein
MGTEFIGIPEQLMLKVKEAAQRDEISVDELVQEALVHRINEKRSRHIFSIGDRNVKRTHALPEDVESEISAHRAERAR